MVLKFEDLRVLRTAEAIADDVWREVSGWDAFAREVFGSQFTRATDSIGANIAEAFGRYRSAKIFIASTMPVAAYSNRSTGSIEPRPANYYLPNARRHSPRNYPKQHTKSTPSLAQSVGTAQTDRYPFSKNHRHHTPPLTTKPSRQSLMKLS